MDRRSYQTDELQVKNLKNVYMWFYGVDILSDLLSPLYEILSISLSTNAGFISTVFLLNVEAIISNICIMIH